MRDLVWIDTETTGLDSERCHITEIAAVRYDPVTYRWKDEASFLVWPGKDAHWEDEARQMGFDHDKWGEGGAVHVDVALARILPMFADATPAGQNVNFDTRFMESARRGLVASNSRRRVPEAHPMSDRWIETPWPAHDYHRVDLMALAWPLYAAGQIPGVSLRHTSKFFGVPDDQAHRARRDVHDSIHVYQGIMRLYSEVAECAAARVAEWRR